MVMFEYSVIKLPFARLDQVACLNLFGRDGWELVNVTVDSGVTDAYLKREKFTEKADTEMFKSMMPPANDNIGLSAIN